MGAGWEWDGSRAASDFGLGAPLFLCSISASQCLLTNEWSALRSFGRGEICYVSTLGSVHWPTSNDYRALGLGLVRRRVQRVKVPERIALGDALGDQLLEVGLQAAEHVRDEVQLGASYV